MCYRGCQLSLCKMMNSSFWFTTTNLGWPIVFIKGCQVIIKNIILYFLISLTNSVNPDEMLHYAGIHLGLRCL